MSFLCAFLAGCGGGGGGSTPASTPAYPRTAPTAAVLNAPDDVDYAARKAEFAAGGEYNVSWKRINDPSIDGTDRHLDRINAAAAYARGATGTGQTIAIVDSGILQTHREFSGSGKVTKKTDPGYYPTDRDKFHGTAVAALAVGNRDGGSGLNMHGVAFDARVHFTEIRLGESDGIYRPYKLENHSDLDDRSDAKKFSEIIKTAQAANAAIVNASFGVNGAISQYDWREVRSRLGHTAAALAQASTRDADKVIIVWAAGNAGGHELPDSGKPVFDSPELRSGLGAYFPKELQSHVLAVVALDQDGTIASYSNRCGIAKSFCLAAPGSAIVSAGRYSDTSYTADLSFSPTGLFYGTSFAAPLVSGSLALLRQYFRGQLGNTELVDRLLATANRKGIYADSAIYGHGLVDLDAATAPVGALMTGLPGDPGSRPLADSGITASGGAFGASLQRQLADVEMVGFDALGAPFFQSAGAYVAPPVRVRNHTDGIEREVQNLPLTASPWVNSGAKLSLAMGRDGRITEARFAGLADGWWLSYGHHAGQALGLYTDSSVHDINRVDYRMDDTGSAVKREFGDPLAFTAPYLSLVRHGPGIGWSNSWRGGGLGFALMHGTPQFDGYQNPGGERGIGALLDYRLRGRFNSPGLWLQAGVVREADGFLGTRPRGAFGAARATTTFAGVNGTWALGSAHNRDVRGASWRLLASAYLGHTRSRVGHSLLRDAGTISSSTFSVGVARASLWRHGDWFGLQLSQPLRVERGNLALRLPTGRTRYGQVLHKDYDVNLAPTGRSILARTTYRLLVAGDALTTNVGVEHQPQHQSGRGIQRFIRLSFEKRF